MESNYPDEKTVVAPPLTKRIEALEFTDPHIPGEIVVDKSGKLLKTFFNYEGKIGSLIDEENDVIQNRMEPHIASRTITTPDGIVSFENVTMLRPRIATGTNTWESLLPQQARESGYTYASEMYVDLVQNKGMENEERLPGVFLGSRPVMLGSILDNLSQMSEQERVNVGESIYDPYGYYVIKGVEKVVLIQEQLRHNRIFIFNSSSKGDVVCKVTNNTLMGSTNVTMVRGKKSGALKMHLGFMGRRKTTSKIGNTMSVFQIYRMLGITDPTEILRHISQFTKPEYVKRMFVALQPTFVKLNKVGDDIEYIAKKKGVGDINYAIKKSDIMNDLINQLFPQIPADDIANKLNMLSIMTVRLLEYIIGVRELDDRDNWGNKQLVSAGKSLERLFSSIWRELINRAQDEIDKKNLRGLQSVRSVLNPSFVTDNFVNSFTANNWGVSTSYLPKENITDILKRDSILSVYSHLTKINTPTSRQAKSAKIRLVQMSQLGYVSAAETPEGEQCLGNVPVTMGDFSQRMISELKNGDVVMTYNTITGELEPSPIYNVFHFHTSERNKKVFKLIAGEKEIIGTDDHPFWTQRGWIKFIDLTTDDILVEVSLQGDEVNTTKIDSIEPHEDIEVWDFTTVSDNHSFIANGIVTHNCGLVKNSALTNYISINRDENVVLEHVSSYINQTRTEQSPNPFLLNGIFRGWVDGVGLRNYCVGLRRQLSLYKDTLIILNREGYFLINTDASRATRPLLIVDVDGRLVIEKKDLWNANMDVLLREGCVEYIDAEEQEYIMLAQTMDEVEFRLRDLEKVVRDSQTLTERLFKLESKLKGFSGTPSELGTLRGTIEDVKVMKSQAEVAVKELSELPKYTHSEMDPTAIESIAVSIIPLPETNPGPRMTYQAGMGKQALGIYHSNHLARFETTAKVLAYPSRPMFETQMNEVLGLNELPAGEMVTLAITTYGGYSQEDAIIMSQGAIDRGLFRYIVYKTYKSIQKRTRTTVEEFGRPIIRPGENENRYHAIDDNGLPRIGSMVREGDCVIGKIRKNLETNEVENASSYLEIKQEGVVDKVLVSTNPEGNRVIKVKIREVRKPIIGDKFASRYAQKGTIGMILPDEDMPYTAEGVRPDILINPHSIPSRMTIGKMIEIVASKVAVFDGERVNATAFRRFDVREFMRALQNYGYSGSGKERMYSGFTGKPLEAMIFTGPCYYQALRHHVSDKIQMRARGGIKQLTHQPVGGRKRGGGQRVGEMERDAIISHGASAFLNERLCLVSDAYETVYCSTCGTIAVANHMENKYVCRTCEEDAEFGTCTIPYSYKLLTQLLGAAHFQIKLGFKKSEKNV